MHLFFIIEQPCLHAAITFKHISSVDLPQKNINDSKQFIYNLQFYYGVVSYLYLQIFFQRKATKVLPREEVKGLRFLYKIMQRSDIRLLSSLRDLRLRSKCQMVLTEERKRKQKRLCPIKVRPEDQEIYENFKIVNRKKNLLDITFIIRSLEQHFTFAALIADRGLQDKLVEEFRLCKVEEGQYLLKQNDNASSFFILKEGELDVEVNGLMEGKINNGEGFGELALLYSTPRSASILARKSSQLWFIDRATFRGVVSRIIGKTLAENKKFVNENKFFAYLTEKQKLKISSIAITQRYETGSKVCREGELGSAMYIIKKGRLNRSIQGITIGSYSNGDSLEQYVTLTKNSRRKETITAEQPTQLIAFGADQIEKVLGRSLPLIILRNSVKNAIMQDKNLKQLSKQFIEKVIDCFRIERMPEGDIVFNETDLCKNKILFFIEGEYELTKNAAKSSIYGTKALLNKSRKETFGFSCKMLSEGKIAVTNLQEIEKGLGFSIEQAIKKSVAIKKIYQGRKSVLTDLQNASKNFQLKNFLVVKKLGQGQFGVVFLVIHYETKKPYALKCISKAETIKYKLEKHVINEKTVLQSHSSPFTVDFIRSFKDSNFIYFLTEFIEGLELFDALRVIGLVPMNLAKFYTASIILAIESLHNKGIVYRDLKPENVMIQNDGYLKIIDMGTCKNLRNSASQKTFTIIGTPNYMGPEILSGKGYGYSVDLWSLGVVLFQFLSGFLPFGQNCEDPYQIYEQILKSQLKFPKYMRDAAANNLITRLLNKNSESRIGSSFSALKNHEFFNDIEWHQIIEKKTNPSFKPTANSLVKGNGALKAAKPVQHYLKSNAQSMPKRADLDPKWDECF